MARETRLTAAGLKYRSRLSGMLARKGETSAVDARDAMEYTQCISVWRPGADKNSKMGQ